MAFFAEVTQHLNDKARMESWQAGFPAFSREFPVAFSEPVNDYLECYGLKDVALSENIQYFAGFKESKSYRIFHQYFKQKEASELVLIAHGYTDHAGLFAKLIRHLISEGYSIAIFDQPGHGISSGERATIDSFDCYIELFAEFANDYYQYTGEPFHLLGQSMGGAITMDWFLSTEKAKDMLRSFILYAPLVRPKAWLQAVWSIRFLSLVVDSIPRTYSRNSEDEEFTNFVRHIDPVQHDRLPAQWVRSMIEWAKDFESRKDSSDFPVSIIQGDDDQTVDWTYNLEHIRKKFPNTSIHMIEGAGHHLAGESERLQKIIFSYTDDAFKKGK